jgi:hypothetical protein
MPRKHILLLILTLFVWNKKEASKLELLHKYAVNFTLNFQNIIFTGYHLKNIYIFILS